MTFGFIDVLQNSLRALIWLRTINNSSHKRLIWTSTAGWLLPPPSFPKHHTASLDCKSPLSFSDFGTCLERYTFLEYPQNITSSRSGFSPHLISSTLTIWYKPGSQHFRQTDAQSQTNQAYLPYQILLRLRRKPTLHALIMSIKVLFDTQWRNWLRLRRSRPVLRNLVYGTIVFLALYILINISVPKNFRLSFLPHNTHFSEEDGVSSVAWNDRAEKVKQAFKHAYGGYARYAAPEDELRPLTNTGVNMCVLLFFLVEDRWFWQFIVLQLQRMGCDSFRHSGHDAHHESRRRVPTRTGCREKGRFLDSSGIGTDVEGTYGQLRTNLFTATPCTFLWNHHQIPRWTAFCICFVPGCNITWTIRRTGQQAWSYFWYSYWYALLLRRPQDVRASFTDFVYSIWNRAFRL